MRSTLQTVCTALLTMLWLAGAPRLFVMLGLAALAQTLLLFALTLFWKVSVHAAATGALAALASLGWWPAPLAAATVLLVGVVGWARVRLDRHTPAQVLVGITIGASTLAAAMWGLLWG